MRCRGKITDNSDTRRGSEGGGWRRRGTCHPRHGSGCRHPRFSSEGRKRDGDRVERSPGNLQSCKFSGLFRLPRLLHHPPEAEKTRSGATAPLPGRGRGRSAKDTGSCRSKKKGPDSFESEPFKERQLPTLPPGGAVPSAMAGLTSLFGMGRGGSPPL